MISGNPRSWAKPHSRTLRLDGSPLFVPRVNVPNTTQALDGAGGRQTLELIKAFNPDIFLLDITLPGFSGLELLKEIDKFPRVRVVVLTLNDMHPSLTVGTVSRFILLLL